MKSLSFLTLTCVLAFGLTVTGCSSKNKTGKDGDLSESELSEAELNAQREERFGLGSIPTAEKGGPFRDVHFDYDSSSISDSGRQAVEFNAQVLQDNPKLKVQLEGHCDERGTAEYNLALGARRARAVYDSLVAYGVPATRLDTISYGEEVPVDTGSTEDAWAQNRRVHFSGFSGNQG